MAAARRMLHRRVGVAAGGNVLATLTDIRSAADVLRWASWGSYGETIRLNVGVPHLVMQGGFNFSQSSHPFVAALSEGIGALESFYSQCSPGSLCEYHGVQDASEKDWLVPAWEVPWIQRVARLPPPGECGLGPEHGVSFYGPVSPDKLALEYRRLVELRAAIQNGGYQPGLYGDIDGYFMLDQQGQYRFFVRGGKHRAAVLAHLGWTHVPVVFKREWPRVVRLRDSSEWPLVHDGTLAEPAARAVFSSYFSGARFG